MDEDEATEFFENPTPIFWIKSLKSPNLVSYSSAWQDGSASSKQISK